jgi:hypothetical protein
MAVYYELQQFWVAEQRDLHGDDGGGARGLRYLANLDDLVQVL